MKTHAAAHRVPRGEQGRALFPALVVIAVVGAGVLYSVLRISSGQRALSDDPTAVAGVQSNLHALTELRRLINYAPETGNQPYVFPDPYIASSVALAETRARPNHASWSFVDGQFSALMPGPSVSPSEAPTPGHLPDANQASDDQGLRSWIVLLRANVSKSFATPYLLDSLDVEVRSNLPPKGRGVGAKSERMIRTRVRVPLPPPPHPSCMISVSNTEVDYGRPFDVGLLASGVTVAGFLLEPNHGYTWHQVAGVPNAANSVRSSHVAIGTTRFQVDPPPIMTSSYLGYPREVTLKGRVEGVDGSMTLCSRTIALNPPPGQCTCDAPTWSVKPRLLARGFKVMKEAEACFDPKATPKVQDKTPGKSGWVFARLTPSCKLKQWRARDYVGCFAPETRILMADGTLMSIVDVERGDYVWNPVRGRAMRVTDIVAGPEKPGLYELSYRDVRIHVTAKHPVVTDQGIRQARDLTVGDRVLGADGSYHALKQAHQLAPATGQYVYNLVLGGASQPEDHMVVAGGMVTGDFYVQKLLEQGGAGK